MQYSVFALFALAATAFASRGSPLHARLTPRQNSNVPVNAAAMADANGNVVPYNSNRVYLDAQAKGQ